MADPEKNGSSSNIVPFRPRPGPEQMVREVEAALRRMWDRAAEEPLPDRIANLLDELERREAEVNAQRAQSE